MHDTSRDSIRRRLLRDRRALAPTEAEQASRSVTHSVIQQLEDFAQPAKARQRPGVLAGYRALPGEIDPAHAIDALIERGWSLVLPVCGPNGQMDFCPWSPGEELRSNALGVDEPLTNPVPIDHIDAVIVPGVAFDQRGNRLGHGVGYYDRFFGRCAQQSHHPYRLGLAYDFQIVELPDPETWDIPMHSVVSPSQVIDTSTCE